MTTEAEPTETVKDEATAPLMGATPPQPVQPFQGLTAAGAAALVNKHIG